VSSGESDEENGQQEDGWLAGGAGAGRRGKRRNDSRHVRPLRTTADRISRSAAILANAAAAAAAVIAQRRAAGERITAEAEQRERQQQLEAAMKGGKRRRRAQKRQQQGPQLRVSAISGPRDLIQSWRRHHKGVETRPSKAAGAAAAAGTEEQQRDEAAAGRDSAEPGATAAGQDAAAAAAGNQADDAAVAAHEGSPEAGAAAVAATPLWPYGAAPTTPVVAAMHLITSLLHLVASQGSLPPDASLALMLRFSQAEVAAAFRWLRALGWLNSGAARRPFQLSTAWMKRLRGEAVLSDLMDRAPAAALALMKAGLLQAAQDNSSSGSNKVVEHPAAAAAVYGSEDGEGADAAGRAAAAEQQQRHGLVQLLEQEVQQLEQQQQRAAKEAADSEAGKAAVKETGKQTNESSSSQDVVREAAAATVPVEGQDEQMHEAGEQQQGTAAASTEGQTADPMDVQPAGREQDGVPVLPQQQQAVVVAAAATARPSPSSLSSCLAALIPVAADDTAAGFWVGQQPKAAAPADDDGSAAAQASSAWSHPVPGALLLELLVSAAAGNVQLSLCTIAQNRSSREGSMGEAGTLLAKMPQLLIKAEPAVVVEEVQEAEAAAAAASDDLQEDDDAVEAPALAASQQPQVQLVPAPASSGDDLALLAYCGAAATEERAAGAAAVAAVAVDRNAEGPTAACRKRTRDDSASPSPELESGSAVSCKQQQPSRRFKPLVVGKDAAVRKEAEEACMSAAACRLPLAPAAPAAGVAAERPGKRQKAADSTHRAPAVAEQQGQGALAEGSSSRVLPPPELVKVLLAAVRQAGPLGATEGELLQHLAKAAAGPAGASADAASTGAGKDGQAASKGSTAGTAAATVEVQAGGAEASTSEAAAAAVAAAAATAAAAAAAAAELAVAFAALPAVVLQLPAAAAAAAVRSSMALLRRYGLVRRVPSWQDHAWVCAEDSCRLLARPVPEQHHQQQQPAAQEGAATAAATAGAAAAGGTDGTGAAPAEVAVPASATSAPALKQSIAEEDTARSQLKQQQQGAHEALVAAWLDHKGRLNQGLWRSLVKRVMGLVLRNPGIPEPLLLAQLDVVSPAAVKQLLVILQNQGHLLVRPVSVPAVCAGVDGSGAAAAAAAAGSDATGVLSQGAALRLGTGLAGCATSAAKPPSFLARKKVGGAGNSVTAVAQPQQHLLVLHYWPSLSSSTTCYLTCTPPDAVMAA
jgi:hypothetical protein